ncbi:DnaJ domain-containing protein [Paludicola sp. MB14-C6]|uniref:J domain-containing protein n=1 Tax=Paludihabitans sp. MB14-C6 TaxID=3070656 RepID=UPI0027DD301F|nr:DnaJ domain-containing protein [Paludicola sp. MB14-C6]WMJ23582.1 DnaJ domain-containing protein [Paludicola sp. MB14-C6]
MNNPYNTLGVNENATDEQVKQAYRELAKKYHPDNYNDSPLREFADEKMAEINSAFDQIMNNRRSNGSNSSSSSYQSQQNTSNYSSYTSSNFADIRSMIQANRLVEAEELLDGVPLNKRDAEWYFLKGSIFYSRGWLDDAMNHFSSACRMDPNNAEYRAALNRMGWQRQGNMGGYGQGQYRAPQRNAGGCSGCDMCCSLLCADSCCECMGGDLISCC